MAFAVSDNGIGIAPEQLPFLFYNLAGGCNSDADTERHWHGTLIVRAFTELLGVVA